jgi:hypothetical protein
MQKIIRKFYWILSAQFGINPKQLFYSLFGLPRYIRDFLNFRKKYQGSIELMPCLHDWFEEGGSTKTEYFWQDLYVAKKINEAKPSKHVDIGSRVDGFVAHVASFREIEIFDIRQITYEIPNIVFKQADLMKPLIDYIDYCDSLSCLHALEHFGLGRYGDNVNVDGYKLGLVNMTKILKQNGTFYLSTPIGLEKVAFNAHRIFNPVELRIILGDIGFELKEFAWFDEDKKIIRSEDIDNDLTRLSHTTYALGIFTFVKK